MPATGLYRSLRTALIVVPLALGVAGCESMDKYNPFAEKQTPLPGVRKPLFPEGVPGVEFGSAPQQPANSNIPITPSIAEGQQQDSSGAGQPPAASTTTPAPAPQQPAPPAPRTASKSKAGDPNDAWSGTR